MFLIYNNRGVGTKIYEIYYTQHLRACYGELRGRGRETSKTCILKLGFGPNLTLQNQLVPSFWG